MHDPIQPRVVPSLSRRILSRLERALHHESDPWLRDDLKIAYRTVLYAARGDAVGCSPHVLASYEVLGLHPEKVWPAIQARQQALCGPLFQSGAPPKKPAQAVKLWCEKTNGARAINSRAGGTLLRDNTNSVPMAAPSIAALYPNSDECSSAKKREYTLDLIKTIIERSGAPPTVVAVTLAALSARGDWPEREGPATTILSVALKGLMYESIPSCCRRTAQRRIKRALKDGYWRFTRNAHSWTDCPKCGAQRKKGKCESCGYRGRSKDAKGNWTGEFMRVPTYEFDIEKFRHAPRCKELHQFPFRTYAEYKAAAKRGEHPNVTEMPRKTPQPAPPDPPPATSAPLPVKQPAAEHAHRNPQRVPQPKLNKTEAAKFVADMAVLMKGVTRIVEKVGGYGYDLDESDPRYRPKLPWDQALRTVAERWHRDTDSVIEALRIWGYKPSSP